MILMQIFFLTGLYPQRDNAIYVKNQLKWSPLSFFADFSGLKLSYERALNKHFSTQITGTYIADFFNTVSQNFNHRNGYTLGIDQKYFFINANQFRAYFSLEFERLKCRYNDVVTFEKDSIRKSFFGSYYVKYSDSITVNRCMNKYDFRFGMQIITNHLVLDFGIGIGYLDRSVSHSNRINPTHNLRKGWLPFFSYPRTVEGRYQKFYLPIGFKIGYAF
jgi:hypothetical protein